MRARQVAVERSCFGAVTRGAPATANGVPHIARKSQRSLFTWCRVGERDGKVGVRACACALRALKKGKGEAAAVC